MSAPGKAPADGPKIQPTDNVKPQRLPAPTLFVGPPSRNASNISINAPPKDPANPARIPLSRQLSLLGVDRQKSEQQDASTSFSNGLSANPFNRQQQQSSKIDHQNNERVENAIAEMQNTLEDVELSAASGTHVFGPDHSKALEELRTAQIALAQAWAKSEAEEESQNASNAKEAQVKPLNTADLLAADRAEFAAEGRARSGTDKSGGSGKTQLEEETENDIALARKRREANDKYFQRVNKGVVEVVQKLEEVAKAMKGVERESKEIWGDTGSTTSGSIS
ncbi:hypothetical protein E2P81_ATG07647 [Venturia nashicola]|uniref:Uncharacterized protein n=1 Tax=Venturia nashicola TaxID=86259 RepID=A0A4Z1P5B1_9PEZI|nr:hypothetical protein E6O75_ATG07810 [Venturia nashicola]TLD22454.1 hypothetical protein E2P81_ATG07647 [Venturia nashicola]